ncbi:MAG: translational GTPase TypA [Candidatus Levybacteria bacterium]|nr:translational GTPase TypA [Candidatus Levybacteria bacterium]
MQNIRNIAIIAHVDHGKTTLVDSLLKQTHTFRDNQKEMSETLIMDSNDLEKEKGITILSKNNSVKYKDVKINIIDTPGHADFGGEVERILNMADGAILLVDAVEGPLPQTKFVLKKALEKHLKIILLINKIDKKDARPTEIINEVEGLFLELATHDDHLNFKTLYAVGRDGKAFDTLPENYTSETPGDLSPLFEAIVSEIPNSVKDEDKPFQMLISTLDTDLHVGKICIGKVTRGKLKKGDMVSLIDEGNLIGTSRVQKLFTSIGLDRVEVDEVSSGDIVAIAGIPELTIGQTVTDPSLPESLPKIHVEDPTIRITVGPNTSPFLGKEGKLFSSSQIKDRLLREKETNLGLKIEQDEGSSNFAVSGRGELHLAVLIENMRREGFELEISKPQVIYKTIDGKVCEPYEEVTIDVGKDYIGVITEEFAKRKATMINMTQEPSEVTRFVYKVSSKNLLGVRNVLLTKTRGTVELNTFFLGYYPKEDTSVEQERPGVLISFDTGTALSYGLENAQERGTLFIKPNTSVYEGMIIGISTREHDMEINVTKGKKMTNVRSSTSDMSVQIDTPTELSLEQALDFINADELLEVTPQTIRLRKRFLSATERKINSRKA